MSREILSRFVEAVRAGKVPDADTLTACADAFDAILEGEPAERALGLTRERGRPKQEPETEQPARTVLDKREREIRAVVEVLNEYEQTGSYDIAEERIAPRYAKTPRTLKRWREKYGEVAEGYREMRTLMSDVRDGARALESFGHEIPGDATVPTVLRAAHYLESLRRQGKYRPDVHDKEIEAFLRSE